MKKLILLTFLLVLVDALYQQSDAADADVPKIKSTLVYTTTKIAQIKKTNHDIYKLKGACNLDNVYTKDWVQFDGSPL
jgi:hypothetical protein